MADTGTFFPPACAAVRDTSPSSASLKQGAGINQGQASLAVADARYRARMYPGNEDLDVSVYATPLQQQLVSGSLRLNLFCRLGLP